MMPKSFSLTIDSLKDHMVWVAGGAFIMGGESGYDDSKPEHPVQLDDFYLCRYAVTQALWREVMGQDPAELAFPHPLRPVEGVSWYDAVAFCNALSERAGLQPAYDIDPDHKDPHNQPDSDSLKWTVTLQPGADGYRLPTEAEWEYAARGGVYAQAFAYVGGPNQKEVAWYRGNSQDLSQPVGLKPANALGLYDMSGNVREWCWDWYGKNYYEECLNKGLELNPKGPVSGDYRVVRGGSWFNDLVDYLRVAFRNYYNPYFRFFSVGFRLCRYPAR